MKHTFVTIEDGEDEQRENFLFDGPGIFSKQEEDLVILNVNDKLGKTFKSLKDEEFQEIYHYGSNKERRSINESMAEVMNISLNKFNYK